MKLLSILSPAETIVLMDSSCSLKDMMKFTLMDLLLKKILEIDVEKKKAIVRDKYAKKVEVIKSYSYVVKGKNFDKYTPHAHELIFLSPYQKSASIKILFKHLIKTAYENAGSNNSFKREILKSKNLENLIKVNFFQRLFGGMSLTKEGLIARHDILEYLRPIDKNIDHLLNNDKEKALEVLLSLRGNIFLLNNLNFDLLKKIDKELLEKQKSVYTSYDNVYDWMYYIDFYGDIDTFDSYFDNTMDSFDSDFDAAGCSSCSTGCSSCGGCGGCGGCS